MIDLVWIVTILSVIILGALTAFTLINKSKRKLAIVLLGIGLFILPLRVGLVWSLYTHAEPIDSTLPYILKNNVQNELPLFSQTKTSVKVFDNSKRQFFVLYKVGCPYCNGAHAEIERNIAQLKDKTQIHYVETSTPLGKKLVKKYHIQKAHTMIVTNPQKNEAQMFEEGLAKTLASGKTSYQADKASIHQAFKYFTE
ncbi:hypothetical protein [Lactococcus lactis]|uniref:Thioredoxin domain-containing protein n=2 Tax=Lactococcus lactis TaxID=1358 RepID=A0AAW8UCZ1_9LACT|nr:hypothetical protein [Lactococcus lactis]AWN66534.1 hypothetical protein LL14B4_10250 [Lactococcus lactis subsp. lactis]MDT2882087.1 hypothetical protein [Lactococcus lactis]MDT2946754.1 hypothetical protein [Lactococcus lactis]MDT2947574.1 hypothetical protein [Lactococcus lactis]